MPYDCNMHSYLAVPPSMEQALNDTRSKALRLSEELGRLQVGLPMRLMGATLTIMMMPQKYISNLDFTRRNLGSETLMTLAARLAELVANNANSQGSSERGKKRSNVQLCPISRNAIAGVCSLRSRSGVHRPHRKLPPCK
eukprot:GHVU01163437.1.p2 GENE.GHVU01163437.1~~GHVU01163437.1.p2  ORF type:complete len:140 (+),score=13.61 GHVU01163437.1:1495-1914(+)